MSGNAEQSGAQRHLSLVQGAPRARPGLRSTARSIRLEDASFRPGELPVAVVLRLPSAAVERSNRQADLAGAPVELWVRAAIDAGRIATVVAAARPADVKRIVAGLDEQAASGIPMLSASPDLALFAEALRRGEPASVKRLGADGEAELLVPEDLAHAWRCEAAASQCAIDDWAAAMIELAPDNALTWEAAAAASGLRLAEWGYAYALRRLVSSSA